MVTVTLLWTWTPAAGQYYHTYDQITEDLEAAEIYCHELDFCKRYDLGLSFQGRHIWALRISDNISLEEDEPEFKYISTMHGDEPLGTAMCMYLIDHLLVNYGVDPDITNLVNEIDIWIVPLMNPDGYESSPRRRRNLQIPAVDLNRDFPEGSGPTPDPNDPTGRAPETQVIMNWSFAHSFTLAGNFHTGALVVNYPYDKEYGVPSGDYAASPDDDLFIEISEEYSQHNSPMWNSPYFYHGITNGSDWYSIDGGMQDWSYRYMACNEVTIELSNTYEPPPSQLPQYWDDNRDSMLAYMATCLVGVRGVVTDAHTGLPIAATIMVVGRDHEVYTDPDVGDYHRMLLPGTYDLVFAADGFHPLTVFDVVVLEGDATRLDVSLAPADAIPTVSEWGVLVMTLLVLTAGTLVFGRRERMRQSMPVRIAMFHKRSVWGVLVLLLWTCPVSFADERNEMHSAARIGDLERLEYLLNRVPDLVNAKDGSGQTPLHQAVRGLHTEAVKRLLVARADANAKDRHGAAPLHLAALSGRDGNDEKLRRQAVTTLLLDYKADVKATDEHSKTVLHIAAIKNRTEMLDRLAAAGADVGAKDLLGRTPLHDAALYDHKAVIKWLLLKGAEVNASDKQGDTPLHWAARRFRKEATDMLIAAGARVNAKNARGQTPLHIVASQGPEVEEVDRLLAAVAAVLLENKAEVNPKDSRGATPLHYALTRGHEKLAELLQQHGGRE